MVQSGTSDWELWKKSLLFWLDASDPEMYRVVISWITGALLPIVALGLTALVAQNIQLKDNEEEKLEDKHSEIEPTLQEDDDLNEFEEAWNPPREISKEEFKKFIDETAIKHAIKPLETPKKVKELLPEGAKKVLAPRKKKKALKKNKQNEEAKKLLDELKKPSKGEELIQKINSGEIDTKNSEILFKKDDNEKDVIPENNDAIQRDGVEVIDVKIVPKDKVDKFGIPIKPNERKSWDKI